MGRKKSEGRLRQYGETQHGETETHMQLGLVFLKKKSTKNGILMYNAKPMDYSFR